MSNWDKEDYRVFLRDCHNFGNCNHRSIKGLLRQARNGNSKPANEWDINEICPDTVAGDAWDYDQSQSGFIEITDRTIILDQNVDLAGDGLIIGSGGKLIFKVETMIN